jgi:tetratricopeptide (TPR) repeat protein
VIVDALTQLGRYPQAHEAVQRMLDVQPGLASLARASYDRELHGDADGAAEAMRRALALASDPGDMAFCQYSLGELAFNSGDPGAAAAHYKAAVNAEPRYQLSFAGLAKAHAALGQTADAVEEYDRVVRVLPLPHLQVEYGDLLSSLGRQSQANAQYDLVEAERALFADNGGSDHLVLATFLADHGRVGEALDHARAEWSVRPTVQAADALAWALHRNDRDEEALKYADIAGSLGWRNATFRYHRGAIGAALGDEKRARADLAQALAINPHFDILQAPIARQLLSTLDESV